MRPQFTKIDMRTPDMLGSFTMTFQRFAVDKFTLTTVCYGKALYRGVLQEIVENVTDTVKVIDTKQAWESPLFTTLQDAIDSCVRFSRCI